MKDYASEFKKKISEIEAESKNINIINAGIMNHGKSSLFNSLMDKKIFAAQDVRTTVVNQAVQWFENIYMIDTPGLEAEESDDIAAYDAYRRANMIIFVHNVKVGELHEKELNAINKIKTLFNNDEFFCNHFCLALTFKDSDSEDNILSIHKKALDDIKNHCGISNFRNFIVSNSRYQKGVEENKKNMVLQSGIPELREFLKNNFSTWKNENKYFCAMRISNEKNLLVEKLQQERAKIQNRINSKTDDIKKRQQNFLYKVEEVLNQKRAYEQNISSAQSQLHNLKSNLQDTRERWNRERY